MASDQNDLPVQCQVYILRVSLSTLDIKEVSEFSKNGDENSVFPYRLCTYYHATQNISLQLLIILF